MTDLGPASTVFDNVDMSREDLDSHEVHEDVEDDSSSLLVNDLSLFNNSGHFLIECCASFNNSYIALVTCFESNESLDETNTLKLILNTRNLSCFIQQHFQLTTLLAKTKKCR